MSKQKIFEEHLMKLLRNSSKISLKIPTELLNPKDYYWFIDNFEKNKLSSIKIDVSVKENFATIVIESIRLFGDLDE